jgi:hypothetical protein
MRTISILLTILCGLAMATLIFGLLNNWDIPLATICSWVGACALCPIPVKLG